MNIKNEFGFINLWIVNITINIFLITIKYFHTLLQILLLLQLLLCIFIFLYTLQIY